jgi:hypothetical protein
LEFRAKNLHLIRELLNIVSPESISRDDGAFSMTWKANDEIWFGRNWHLQDPRKLT